DSLRFSKIRPIRILPFHFPDRARPRVVSCPHCREKLWREKLFDCNSTGADEWPKCWAYGRLRASWGAGRHPWGPRRLCGEFFPPCPPRVSVVSSLSINRRQPAALDGVAHDVRAAFQAEFFHGAGLVGLDRFGTHVELRGDLAVGVALGD